MAKSFRCRLVTPTASVFDEAVAYASIPAWDGLFGVLPGRAPILARMGAGELRVDFPDSSKGEGGSRSYFVEGGFVQMAGEQLTVLAERATPAEQLSATDAQKELDALMARSIPDGAKDRQAQVDRLNRDRQCARQKIALARAQKGI
ncbi:MAG: F0F1 ATP synthase subunit epsilon [Phycisphaerales bacterium]|nr:F0F1 ATP synthase subunit epsilon [Phycisphaerales bacterium]